MVELADTRDFDVCTHEIHASAVFSQRVPVEKSAVQKSAKTAKAQTERRANPMRVSVETLHRLPKSQKGYGKDQVRTTTRTFAWLW